MQEWLDAFNSEENKDGSMIRVLLGSRVIVESITLLNVRQFHSMSPHWNYSKLNQAIGRVIRTRSHAGLGADQRNVEIHVYIADETVDVRKLKTCRDKQEMIEEKETILEEISIKKYFKDGSALSTVITDNFLLYYMERYMDKFEDEIGKIFLDSEEQTFDDIAEMMKGVPS